MLGGSNCTQRLDRLLLVSLATIKMFLVVKIKWPKSEIPRIDKDWLVIMGLRSWRFTSLLSLP